MIDVLTNKIKLGGLSTETLSVYRLQWSASQYWKPKYVHAKFGKCYDKEVHIKKYWHCGSCLETWNTTQLEKKGSNPSIISLWAQRFVQVHPASKMHLVNAWKVLDFEKV